MKAVALTIEALALLNNEERKKKCKMALWPISVYKLLYGSGLQKGKLVMIMKTRYFLKL